MHLLKHVDAIFCRYSCEFQSGLFHTQCLFGCWCCPCAKCTLHTIHFKFYAIIAFHTRIHANMKRKRYVAGYFLDGNKHELWWHQHLELIFRYYLLRYQPWKMLNVDLRSEREFSLDIASRLDLAIARCACFRGKAICFHEEYRAYMRPYHTHRDMKPKHRYHRNHGPWDESVMWKCKRLPFVVINCECIFFSGNFSTGLSYTLIKVPS